MALYRKYRPASFAEVVGQEQVTKPLSIALDSGRINHAYLFSGPRGCGKTSSARILARSLNCVNGPTSQPCGVCPSCVSLAPGGPGNLDVTELDAASHNGVDEMRELRDRAYYAPAESRYRVFIIDEAHMISNAGFNALLKIVEEPPAHLIFIFATTEPDKLIGTIRSRVHHYPFRLLTPPDMRMLLERTCTAEGVHVEESVFPLVIRAGGGSPRDSLSILDQLLAGAGPSGLTYAEAVPLLGVTDSSLIDAAVNALATQDHAALFTCVDDVINAGHDPRRFATDLLDRLRDLMVLQSVPDALQIGLVDAPADHHPELTRQAGLFNSRTIAALAGQLNDQIEDLRGATSPRLLLEIMCARMMLVATGQAAPAAAEAPAAPAPAATPAASSGQASGANRPRYQRKHAASVPQQPVAAPSASAAPPALPAPPASAPNAEPKAPAGAPAPAPAPASAADPIELVRSRWSEIRRVVGKDNEVAEIMLTEAKVLGLRENTLVIGHNTGALAERLNAEKNNASLTKAVAQVVGKPYAVEVIVGTNPAAQNLPAAPQQAPRKQWNPGRETPAPAEAKSEPQEDSNEPEPAPATNGWGKPAALGGQLPSVPPAPPASPAVKPAPAAPPAAAPEEKPIPRWKQKAERGRAALEQQRASSFGDGVPLPPEPAAEDEPGEDWSGPPPEGLGDGASISPAPEAASEEEEMIREAAKEPANYDHRDARTIAMEMLQAELGARQL